MIRDLGNSSSEHQGSIPAVQWDCPNVCRAFVITLLKHTRQVIMSTTVAPAYSPIIHFCGTPDLGVQHSVEVFPEEAARFATQVLKTHISGG